MTKRRLLTTTLAISLAIGAGTSWRLAEHILWRPADLSRYTEDALRSVPEQRTARYLAERVSQRSSLSGLDPVESALLMSEALGAFHDLLARHDETTAILGSAEVFAVWDAEGAASWIAGFEGLVAELEKKEADPEAQTSINLSNKARTDIDALVAAARALKEEELSVAGQPLERSQPVWAPQFGLSDPDATAHQREMMQSIDLTAIPGPPAEGSLRKRLDRAQLRLVSRLAGDRQVRNAIWWHGSGGFDKTAASGGQNPSDQWQSIAFAHAASRLDEAGFARLAAEIADIQRDALIATWRVKYRDLVPRPNMTDPTLRTALGNPPSPSYASEHAAAGAAAALLLADRDPQNADTYLRLAHDSALSRIWGGVHSASDVRAGFEIGAAVAAAYLGKPVSDLPQVGGLPILDLPLLSGLNAALEGLAGAGQYIATSIFDDIAFAERSALGPRTAAEGPATDLRDLYAGSVALADLDEDGRKEVLVSGRDELRLYHNRSEPGAFAFELAWQAEVEGISGAYFTQSADGMIDGVLGFGATAPRFYQRWDDLAFAPDPQVIHGFPFENFAVQGAFFKDTDGDGAREAFLMQTGFPIDADKSGDYDRGRRPNILLRRDMIGFSFEQYIENPAGSSVAGGLIDLTGDDLPEQIMVSDAGRVQIVDGAAGQNLPLDPSVDKITFGASFTPIEIGGRKAFHVSGVHHGPDWPYGDPDRPGEIDGDLLLTWDASSGRIVDLAQGALNAKAGEWGWGSAAGDIDGNGLADLVILRGFSVNTPYPAGVDIYLQDADGSFNLQGTQFDFGADYPRSVVLEDLDGDGDLDMLISASQQVRTWENTSDVPAAAPSTPASDTRGYMSQVVESDPEPEVQAPAHIRPAAPEDLIGR